MSPTRLLPLLLAILLPLLAGAAPVINEIMFHPAGTPEDPAQEWIELHNSGTISADMSGWRISKGVDFTFPSGTVLAPGEFLVVAANLATFQTTYPEFSGRIVGGWKGRLSNSGETVLLESAVGAPVDEVRYADEGDWALRVRGPLSFQHRGWTWLCEADGGGKTLERRNPSAAPLGQNWGSSLPVGGTPGGLNSLASADVAPLIHDVKHRPQIPRSTDPIVVSAEILNEATGAAATLHWRLDGGVWQTASMVVTDHDGDREATIPPQADKAVLEFYITASDETNSRTWPAPARTSDAAVTPATFAQVTNALIQVDNSFTPTATFTTPGAQPLYRLIMTNAERLELRQIGSTNGQHLSEAAMNGTFISHDGTGSEVRYLCGFRNRGFSSALGPPNNYHVAFTSDAVWKSRSAIQLNCRFSHSQTLGALLFSRAGIAPQEAALVRVRINGIDLAETTNRMYGRYARIEPLGGEWAERHHPDDAEGNIYRLDDHEPGVAGLPAGNLGSGEFRYEGEDPAAYSDTFLRQTNTDSNDWSDLINACRILSAPASGGTVQQPAIADDQYIAAVSDVFDIDQFFTYIAADALIGNQEGGLQTGRADDCSIYIGAKDRRIRWIPHDLDDVFDIGSEAGNPVSRSIFAYDTNGGGLRGLTRLFNHPQLVPRYYAKLLEQMDSWFNSATVDPLIEQVMGGTVPATDATPTPPNSSLAEIKAFTALRRANVLGQIQQNYSLNATTSASDVDGWKRTLDGAATFSGTFNVARTYSITLNSIPVQWFYRTAGSNVAGTWRLVVPAGGGNILKPGVNKVTVQFWDQPNGAGNEIQSLSTMVLYDTGAATQVSGTLQTGSLRMFAPASYIPGKAFLVRLEQLDAQGNLDRRAWDSTVSLSASGIGPVSTATLYNGAGTALVTLGGGGGQPDDVIFPKGSSWSYIDDGSDQGTAWRAKDYPAETGAPWKTGNAELGVNDGDEATILARNGNVAWRTYYFRRHFTLPDPIPAYTAIKIRMRCDDGAIVYVNGQQVVLTVGMTSNMSYTAGSTFARDGTTSPSEDAFEEFLIPVAALVPGDNTMAVEVHNAASGSQGDISFDMEMVGSYPSANPGPLMLTAVAGTLNTQHAITSLGATPVTTQASGVLPAGTTTWSGVINVTGDVIVPTGATLEIAPGTHVLMAGTVTPGDTTGADLIVQSGGTLIAGGTATQPIQITSANPAARWGQLYLNGSLPTILSHTYLSLAGHAPGQGHTSRGPMIRVNNANLTLRDSALSDGPAKAIYSSGLCDFIIRDSVIARMITGPELGDGASLLMEDTNIQEILPHFRESNAAVPDDEDCLYVHNSSGRPVIVRRSVFAKCGDDVFDCLGGPITVEDSILRDGWDKGMSLLNNDLTITRTLIVGCDKAIVPKSNNATTRTINVDRCTIVSADNDQSIAPWGYHIAPNNPDPDTPSTGLYTQNKSGQSDEGATIAITATNCVIEAQEPVKIDAPYSAADTVVRYSNTFDADQPGAAAWPGTGNLATNALFVDRAANDFRLQSGSPCRDSGNPAATDPDGSRVDMGALPFTGVVQSGTITWTPAGGPYHVTDHLTIPRGITLAIQPGTSIYVAQNKRITVNGRLLAEGSPGGRIVFSHIPGDVAPGDCDPIKNGVQTGPPKWGGVRVVDSMAEENIVSYVDFINAQGTSPSGSENWGSIGFIRSWGMVEHCTWSGTHLRMCYGRNSKFTVRNNVFPDMFLFDPVLGRDENPTDFLSSADNNQEPLKAEYPATDPEVQGNAKFTNGLPQGGWWRVYYNQFNGNRGHNDVFDADSGRWNRPGEFVLDCRYNHFRGLTGDEHIDLGGDAYIASNIFERGTKDQWTSDTGYSNAISSGDRGTGTTILVARNLFLDLDHAINLKTSTGTIFEHNTVTDFHPDFVYTGTSFGTPFTQDVKCAAVNVFIPEDGSLPSRGDGGYIGFNILSNLPRIVSGADMRKVNGTVVNDVTTKIEFRHNLVDRITDPSIGANHPGGIFSGTYGVNTPGTPGFLNPAAKDYRLRADSEAKASAPGGLDYGWTVPEWAYIAGGPAAQTSAKTASFTIGGPGLVAYKWRLDGGEWSADIPIGTGGVFPRNTPTVRQATLTLPNLADGTHTLEVLGQDMAGNWQDTDPAKAAHEQFGPTVRAWTVNSALHLVRINEVLADSSTLSDRVELFNGGASDVDLAGWSLTDLQEAPSKYVFPAGSTIPANGYLVVVLPPGAFQLEKEGEAVYLYDNSTPRTLKDSVVFGWQIRDFTIGRIGENGTWALCQPTFGTANTPQRLGDSSLLRINEWFANGNALYDEDWVELSNQGALPVALGGLRLTDTVFSTLDAGTIAPLSFIAANGFVKLSGPEGLGFALNSEQGHLALLQGDSVLDRVFYYAQTTDFSMGRDDSAVTGYRFFELPTAGLSNSDTSPAYANALALLRGLRITEIMYNPVGGNDYEFLELRNTGSTSLDLTGVKFVQGIDFTFPAVTLDAGKNIVLVANLAKFRERYGVSPNIGGTFSGRLDNSGETLALQLPPPFDANILTFSFKSDWQLSTNGRGRSLVVANPLLSAGRWGDKDTWTASLSIGGDPDGAIFAPPAAFSPWLTHFGGIGVLSDDDHDGLSALLEFSLGMDPTRADAGDGAAGTPSAELDVDGRLVLRFYLPENLMDPQGHGATEILYTIEASSDLATWNVIATKRFGQNWSGAGTVTFSPAVGGFVLVTVRDTGDSSTARHLRLRATIQP